MRTWKMKTWKMEDGRWKIEVRNRGLLAEARGLSSPIFHLRSSIFHPRSSRPSQQGIALMTTMVIAGVIGIVLMSVLVWASSHNLVTARSAAWNSALGVAEAGVEEAFAQLKNHSSDRTANSWTLVSGQYTKTRNFGDGYYTVKISSDPTPIITSSGYVKAPLKTNSYIYRTVQVVTTNIPQFYAGLVTKLWIQMNGNNIDVDSFDPFNPTWSTGGLYDPNKRHDQGNIATVSGLMNGFAVGNADIWGKIATGPGGTMTVGSGGSVGDVAWHAANKTGIEPGWDSHDMACTFPAITVPSGTLPPGGAQKVNGVSYQYVLGTGDYTIGDLSGSVYVAGKATLKVTTKLKLSANAITIGPGASLALYVSVADASFGGTSVQNQGGATTNFLYYGLPSNTSVSFGGNTAFTGIIYAPDADISMGGGGGGTPVDVTGAMIGKTLTMNGRFNIHYDESLRKSNPAGFAVSTWKEL